MPRDESLFPVDQRIFLQTLFGNREPITEADFSQRELNNIVAAVQRNQKRTGATTKGNVGYDDYPSGDEIQPGYAPIESTLGRFNYRMSPLSELQATDRYDFWNDERKANVERYENMPAWKRNVTAPLTSLGYLLSLKPRSAAGELGDAFIGREGRDVKIKIPTKKAKGGAVHFDEGGAAFGVFPQMKARRAQQDRTAAANAPLSALRGWAAGTAGLPGDIEGLARAGISQLPPQLLTAFPALRAFGIGSRADPTPQLPTTEFYNEYLPGAQLNATPTGKAFTTAGNLLGGTGSTTLARYGIKSAKATAKAIAEAAPGPASGSRAAQLGVIKIPGGNWLKGSVEDAVKPMKSQPPAISGEIIDDIAGTQLFDDYRKFYDAGNETVGLRQWVEKNHPDVYKQLVGEQGTVLNNFIDKKIAPYIRNEMATPDDPLRAMAEKYAVDKPVKLAEVQARIDDFAAKMEQTARDRGVPVEQLTSMRQQMIGLEKEKALVEAREALHAEIAPTTHDMGRIRKELGFPEEGMGVSPQAKAWESRSDSFINTVKASDMTDAHYQGVQIKNPWLLKVPPETNVYSLYNGLNSDLGFDHLVDELRNATNPASGLPANLLIDPADLGKFTMPQAVDRVADINAWRATQRIEANQAIANNAATQVVKEYPEQGLKWVELRAPKNKPLTEGEYDDYLSQLPQTVQDDISNKAHAFVRRTNPGISDDTDDYMYAVQEKTFDLMQTYANANPRKISKELEAALKYEGDTMQHCVGGYCSDVLEGRSRIYSLRDSKGQPRVTIEVEPVRGSELGRMMADLSDEEAPLMLKNPPQRITQIKGFRNKKPADEYLPMVQDFVKSGNWSSVDDLRNTGLTRKSDLIDKFSPDELDAIGAGEYLTKSEQDELLLRALRPPEGMAHGGLVSNHFDPIKIKQIIAGLDDEYDPENIQQIIAQRESAYA
jgi:hypothetical protein